MQMALNHRKDDPQAQIKEMQVETPLGDTISHLSDWQKSRSLATRSAGEPERETVTFLHRWQQLDMVSSLCRGMWPKPAEMRVSDLGLRNPMTINQLWQVSRKKGSTRLFTAILFVTAQDRKRGKCPSVGGCAYQHSGGVWREEEQERSRQTPAGEIEGKIDHDRSKVEVSMTACSCVSIPER